MTIIKAEIIADSANKDGIRLTTMLCTYPLVIHAEVMTHRVFSRNAASSRAIPIARLIKDVQDNPFIPLHWGKNEPGMQANAQLTGGNLQAAKEVWNEALNGALKSAEALAHWGTHKQLANRILAPFAHIRTLITATDWMNFFALRCHPAAEPHMRELANAMRNAHDESTPTQLFEKQWHLPFVSDTDSAATTVGIDARLLSVARCARVSYLTQDTGQLPDPRKDQSLSSKLLASGHWSPFEHQAVPAKGRHANFSGWMSYRAQLDA